MKKFLIVIAIAAVVFCVGYEIRQNHIRENYNLSVDISYSGTSIKDTAIPKTEVAVKKFIVENDKTFYESCKELEAYSNSTLHTDAGSRRKQLFRIVEFTDEFVVVEVFSDAYFPEAKNELLTGIVEVPYDKQLVVRTSYRSVQGLFYEYELSFRNKHK